MNLDLNGSRVIVTAGGAGIGRAIVEGFLAEGAQVATCDIDEAALATLPGAVFARRVDVADVEALRGFVADAAAAMGGLDCLVNNAGIAGPTAKVEEVALDQWNATLAICLTSHFVAAAAAVPLLRKSGNPSIVNISSLAGRLGFALRSPYAAAKWGVIGLTKSLAIELGGDSIRVNAVLPGIVSGDRQRRVLEARAQARGASFAEIEAEAFSHSAIREYVTPQQIANQVLYLASPLGRTMSGQAISVCGGTDRLG
ncbi:MAG TPA: SDR family oxidoreductase [Paracoccus solventivorans]|uniref:SDR family oxidoreductase n=1 Tax=Paracoccus solventivorans TaxID=53463 RepID=UPI002C3FA6B7|nr:SDR family oxidoreductase [Paracoccus solventivorans]HMM08888.1 SDR family oxidoreductase [Paracoccus solventivorans]